MSGTYGILVLLTTGASRVFCFFNCPISEDTAHADGGPASHFAETLHSLEDCWVARDQPERAACVFEASEFPHRHFSPPRCRTWPSGRPRLPGRQVGRCLSSCGTAFAASQSGPRGPRLSVSVAQRPQSGRPHRYVRRCRCRTRQACRSGRRRIRLPGPRIEFRRSRGRPKSSGARAVIGQRCQRRILRTGRCPHV